MAAIRTERRIVVVMCGWEWLGRGWRVWVTGLCGGEERGGASEGGRCARRASRHFVSSEAGAADGWAGPKSPVLLALRTTEPSPRLLRRHEGHLWPTQAAGGDAGAARHAASSFVRHGGHALSPLAVAAAGPCASLRPTSHGGVEHRLQACLEGGSGRAGTQKGDGAPQGAAARGRRVRACSALALCLTCHAPRRARGQRTPASLGRECSYGHPTCRGRPGEWGGRGVCARQGTTDLFWNVSVRRQLAQPGERRPAAFRLTPPLSFHPCVRAGHVRSTARVRPRARAPPAGALGAPAHIHHGARKGEVAADKPSHYLTLAPAKQRVRSMDVDPPAPPPPLPPPDWADGLPPEMVQAIGSFLPFVDR